MNNEAYLVPNPQTPCQPLIFDPDLCVSCYRCADQCRTDIMVRNAPTEKEQANCENACPAGEAIRWTTYYIQKGQFDKALANIKEENPFPGICGRVCFHPCEEECARLTLDEGVATNALERASFDYGTTSERQTPEALPSTGKTAAIVGGGPAGLTCAYYLALLGHKVTVYEAKPVAGGIPRVNIPEFRLPANVVDSEVDIISGLGIDIRVNSPVDAEQFKKITGDYDAVFVAPGAPLSSSLGVSGEDNENVIGALEFLQKARLENNRTIGEKVVVVGGGNVATDSARLACRMGAKKVTMVCLESRDTMPAYNTEIEEAEKEGIVISPSWGVKEITIKDGKVTGLDLKSCVSTIGADGRFNPVYDETKTDSVEADTVVLAIGQRTDLSFADEKMMNGPRISVDDHTLETPMEGVFAGGDVASAARSIVQAIAAGKRAAISMDIYLTGGDKNLLKEAELTATSMKSYRRGAGVAPLNYVPDLEDRLPTYYGSGIRMKPDTIADEARGSMDEVNKGFIQEKALAEATRCFRCSQYLPPLVLYPDECWFCGTCVEECPVEGAIRLEHPLNQRVVWKRKDTGELFRRGMKNPPAPYLRPPVGEKTTIKRN